LQVCVRIRPLNGREVDRANLAVWSVDAGNNVCVLQKGQMVPKYAFDAVYSPAATNEDVYKQTGAPIVESAMQGINGTIFAYGVTSSGKTHTMLGTPEQPGLVPLALQHTFKLIQQRPERHYLLKLSMLEIYNEVINDLLEPGSTNLRLLEDSSKGTVHVVDLKTIEV
jgi:centromeric protein E